MYIPKHFEETQLQTLHALIKAHPFATLVTLADGELTANHVPMLLDAAAGELGTLRCHVARANPLWKHLAAASGALIVFQGPEAYISPSWYPTKREHGKAVPTWNYAVVHAQGEARAIDDRDWLLAHVTEMSNLHEATEPAPWNISDAPADFIDSMVRAIVGIEIPIAKLSGKWKVSQNRPAVDKPAIAAALKARGGDGARAMAALVEEKITDQ
jgi:transcriptional regulator